VIARYSSFQDLRPGDLFRLATRRAEPLKKIDARHAEDVHGRELALSGSVEVLPIGRSRGEAARVDPRVATLGELEARAREAADVCSRYTHVAPEHLLELVQLARKAGAPEQLFTRPLRTISPEQVGRAPWERIAWRQV